MKTKSQLKSDFRNDFVFMKPMRVSKAKNGNLLIYLNNTTAISLHPNFLKAVMSWEKKAS